MSCIALRTIALLMTAPSAPATTSRFRLRWRDPKNGEPQTLEIGLGSTVLGSSLICHRSIGASHASIDVESENESTPVWIRDLGSKDGTFVDGVQIKVARLMVGQVLRLGTVEIMVDPVADSTTPPPATSVPPILTTVPPQSGFLVRTQEGECWSVQISPTMLDLSHREFRERWADIGERFFLERKLAKHSRNVSRVSREIDLARTYTHKLIKKYGL